MDRAAFTRNTLRDFVSHLSLRITDDDIIVCGEESIGDFPLGGKGLTGTRRTEDQTLGFFSRLRSTMMRLLERALRP